MFQHKILLLLLLSLFFFLPVKQVHASLLGNVATAFHTLVSPKQQPEKKLTLISTITLAPDGDVNHNGQMDTGDTLRFTVTIVNTTDTSYPFAVLKTHLNREQLTFIHNISGTSGTTDDGKTLDFPNLTISAKQQLVISFEARVVYRSTTDTSITMMPELVTNTGQSLITAEKRQITAKKINSQYIPSMMRSKHN